MSLDMLLVNINDLQHKLKDVIQTIRNIYLKISKFKGHLFAIMAMIIYFIFTPKIYADIFIEYGKPIKYNGELPLITDDIKYSIDTNEMIIVEGHNIHRLTGWAFLIGDLDQSTFEKYLVLNSNSRTYYFSYDNIKRSDVQEAYQDLGINVLLSGFNAYISGDHIRSGTYNVGFLFWNRVNNTAFYSVSNLYLVRTPNQVTVAQGEKPDVNDSGKLVSGFNESLQSGESIKFSMPLPKQTKLINYSVESLTEVSINGNSYGKLGGWTFLEGEIDQSKYKRIITLESDYDIYYFPTNHLDRPDVEVVFDYIAADLSSSGFVTYILMKDLPYGAYTIGIVYVAEDAKAIYYSKTDRSIIWSSNAVLLESKK